MATGNSEEITRIIQEIQNSLSCPVCFGTLINPLTIKDCGHSLCSLCTKGIIGANKDGRCPVCTGGSFSRRRGTIPDIKLAEFVEYIKKFETNQGRKNEAISKTDGFLLQGPKLGYKKKTVCRKRRDRPVFSLESNSEIVLKGKEGDEKENAVFEDLLESQESVPECINSVSLLQNEVEDVVPPHVEPSLTTDTAELFDNFKIGLKDSISSVTLYPPHPYSYRTSDTLEPRTSVLFFFNPQNSGSDRQFVRRDKVCRFYQLGSFVPKDSKPPQYLSLIDILRQKSKNNSLFKVPLHSDSPSTPVSSVRKSSSFKVHRHRRLVNDSTPSKSTSMWEEASSGKRLSKEKIIAAEPMPKVAFQESRLQPEPENLFNDVVIEEADDLDDDEEDLPLGPLQLNKKDPATREESEEIHSTQEVISRMKQLKALAAQLDKKSNAIEERVPPSDEEDEIFPSTPESMPKKMKRPSTGGIPLSARKRLKVQKDEASYTFPPGTKIMSSALYTETDNSVYGEFRQAYKEDASFVSGVFDKSIDILVVGTLSEEDSRCNRTVKYLYALACGKLIVSLKWIRECMKKGSLLDPAHYIVKDYSGSNGPQISYKRNENTEPIFAHFQFGLLGEFESDFGAEEIRQLINFGGGRIVRNIHLLVPTENKINLLIADKDVEVNNRVRRAEANKILQETGVVTIDKDWVVESMGKYSPEMIESYLINDIELLYSGNFASSYAQILDEDLES